MFAVTQGWQPLEADSEHVMIYCDSLHREGKLASTIKVTLASIASTVELLGGTFCTNTKKVQLLLKGIQQLEGSTSEGPATTPHEWGEHVNPDEYEMWSWAVKTAVTRVLVA